MGWICAIGFMIVYLITKDISVLFVSAVFAVSGAISEVAVQVKKFVENFALGFEYTIEEEENGGRRGL